MNGLRSDSDERIQHEGSFVHPWMRHGQARQSNYAIPVEQKVNVQGPWRVAEVSLSVASSLDRQNRVQQFPRFKGGFERDACIPKEPPSGAVHGLRLKKGGTRQDDSDSGKLADGVANVLGARTEVRTESEIRSSHDWCVRSRPQPKGLRNALERQAFEREPRQTRLRIVPRSSPRRSRQSSRSRRRDAG